MKKIVILYVICVLSMLSVQAKNVYCEIVGQSASLFGDKCTIWLDFGQERKLLQSQVLVDELGDVIVFNSMIDALNWMGNLGWKFEQAYTVTESSYKNNVYHFLLSKEITEEQLIDEGIHLIHTMKEPDILTLKEYASKDENKAYIALLMKKQLVDSHHKKELSQIFNFEDILKLMQTKTTEELISLSKNYNKYFEKYKTEYVVE